MCSFAARAVSYYKQVANTTMTSPPPSTGQSKEVSIFSVLEYFYRTELSSILFHKTADQRHVFLQLSHAIVLVEFEKQPAIIAAVF